MKIALLMNQKTRQDTFTEATLAKLRSLGEVSLNETMGAEPDIVKAVIRDADIAVTSWGNGSLTADILDCAPGLKLVAHAAGSV
ncbi:MAG: hypothetical protein PHV28_19175, partial [Kiritimatiellae bacterium]|nr:hypothetical protein [Kiritimatiellia bacterium]